ncbi:MAG: CHASE4 domain-containing protein [Pirellulaceae bacterium]
MVHQEARDSSLENEIELPFFPRDAWPASHPLLRHTVSDQPLAERSIRGLVMTAGGPMAVVSRPIIKSGNLPPIHGTLVMGRFLDDSAVTAISEQTAVRFSLTPFTQAGAGTLPTSDALALSERLTPTDGQYGMRVEVIDDSRLRVRSILHDVLGQPILVTQADVERDISQEGRVALRYALASLVIAAFVVLAILLLLLQRIVIAPLTLLTRHANNISLTGDLTSRCNLERRDELGVLAKHFDTMVENVADAQRRLLVLSREAGMSDVASGVLHNVGNVMTNVNVLASSMTGSLQSSKLSGLKKSVQMLRTHKEQLGNFLVNDARGQKLPDYICQVSDHLELEQRAILDQLQEMSASLRHVNQILDSQRKLAKGIGLVESIQAAQLASDAIEMLHASLQRHGVTIEVDCGSLPVLRLDRGKMLQILVNLLTNAKDAVKELEISRRRVKLQIAAVDELRFSIRVSDQGVGISQENLTKIFGRGFTTKPDGHGQGLHFCATTAQKCEAR